MPAKPAGTTESIKQKARRWAKWNRRVFKYLCTAFYHAAVVAANVVQYGILLAIAALVCALTLSAKRVVVFAVTYPDKIIEMAFLMHLEYVTYGLVGR